MSSNEEHNPGGEWGWEALGSEEDIQTISASKDEVESRGGSPRGSNIRKSNSEKSLSSKRGSGSFNAGQNLKGITSSPSFQELEKAIQASLALNISSDSTDRLDTAQLSPGNAAYTQRLSSTNLTQQKLQQQRLRQQYRQPPYNQQQQRFFNGSPSHASSNSPGAKTELAMFVNESESRALIVFHSPMIPATTIRNACSKHGVLYYIRPEFHAKGVTLISYFDLRAAIAAKATMAEELGPDAEATIHYSIMLHATNSNTEEFRLIVENLPDTVVESEIQNIFGRYGPVKSVIALSQLAMAEVEEKKEQQKSSGFSIEYFNIQDARLAMSELSATSNQIWTAETVVKFAPLDERKRDLCRQLLSVLSKWRTDMSINMLSINTAAPPPGMMMMGYAIPLSPMHGPQISLAPPSPTHSGMLGGQPPQQGGSLQPLPSMIPQMQMAYGPNGLSNQYSPPGGSALYAQQPQQAFGFNMPLYDMPQPAGPGVMGGSSDNYGPPPAGNNSGMYGVGGNGSQQPPLLNGSSNLGTTNDLNNPFAVNLSSITGNTDMNNNSGNMPPPNSGVGINNRYDASLAAANNSSNSAPPPGHRRVNSGQGLPQQQHQQQQGPNNTGYSMPSPVLGPQSNPPAPGGMGGGGMNQQQHARNGPYSHQAMNAPNSMNGGGGNNNWQGSYNTLNAGSTPAPYRYNQGGYDSSSSIGSTPANSRPTSMRRGAPLDLDMAAMNGGGMDDPGMGGRGQMGGGRGMPYQQQYQQQTHHIRVLSGGGGVPNYASYNGPAPPHNGGGIAHGGGMYGPTAYDVSHGGPQRIPHHHNGGHLSSLSMGSIPGFNPANSGPNTGYGGPGSNVRRGGRGNSAGVSPIPMQMQMQTPGGPGNMSPSPGMLTPGHPPMMQGTPPQHHHHGIENDFQLDMQAILEGREVRTTVMVRNIPNKYNQQMLLDEVNQRHEGTYDFFYLPIDFKNRCNVGYCFINFMDPKSIVPFVHEFNGQRWRSFNSEKVCAVSFARIQGKQAMIARFQNSSLLEKEGDYQPLLFVSDGPDRGKPEPFPLSNRHRGHSRSDSHGSMGGGMGGMVNVSGGMGPGSMVPMGHMGGGGGPPPGHVRQDSGHMLQVHGGGGHIRHDSGTSTGGIPSLALINGDLRE